MNQALAPPPFPRGSRMIVPVDFSGLDIRITVDIAQRKATSLSTLRFSPWLAGYPIFDLVPEPEALSLNSRELPLSALSVVSPPDNEAPMRVLDAYLDANSENRLELQYRLEGPTVLIGDDGVRLGFFLNDLVERGFLERYAPSNFEFDQFPVTLAITIEGGNSPHRLFCNGDVEQTDANSWKVTFPGYFTCSSIFLHLTNRPVEVRTGTFAGVEREIPLTVYGDRSSVVEEALASAATIMQELERDYGPYAHAGMLVYVATQLEPPLAGMEYCGATMTVPSSLGHEILHSWFGRGVMPGKGNAGWIDEAIAQWRDNRYPRAKGPPDRPPVNLAGFSPYRRHTTRNPSPYFYGSLLLSELDYLLRNEDGLKPVLATLFQEKRNAVIDTLFLQDLLKRETSIAPVVVDDIFLRYVYGRSAIDPFVALRDVADEPRPVIETLKAAWGKTDIAPAPRPFSPEELRMLL